MEVDLHDKRVISDEERETFSKASVVTRGDGVDKQPISSSLPEADSSGTGTGTGDEEEGIPLAAAPSLFYQVLPFWLPPVMTRTVWAHNLEKELALILTAVARHPYIAIDTEFPCPIHRHPNKSYYELLPDERYALLKANVDDSSVTQIGFTLSDPACRLPSLVGTFTTGFIWEFNFKNFHANRDSEGRRKPWSSEFIRDNESHFMGIDYSKFGELLVNSGLICNPQVCWLAFAAAYDLAYLMKFMWNSELPDNMTGFMELVQVYFGKKVFDAKYLARFCNIEGSLEAVASSLGIQRAVGDSHNAGSDSLLTSQVYHRIKSILPSGWSKLTGVICGLHVY